jgi:hypothetical protein
MSVTILSLTTPDSLFSDLFLKSGLYYSYSKEFQLSTFDFRLSTFDYRL